MSQTTRAIVCHDTLDKGGWSVDEVAVREPGEGELLVKIIASGICHSDVLTGDAPSASGPRVLGREGGGRVVSVGSGVKVADPGDLVVLSFASCQNCPMCITKHSSHCVRFAALNDGDSVFFKDSKTDISGKFFGQSSFAGLTIVAQSSVIKVPSSTSKEELVLFSCLGGDVQTGAAIIANLAQAGPEDVVVVNGLGAIGLAAIMTAGKISKCKTIIGVDKIQKRLDLAMTIGATHAINGDTLEGKTIQEAIYELSDSLGSTITIELTGVPPLIRQFLTLTRPGGTYIQAATKPGSFSLDIPWTDFTMSGKHIVGAIHGNVTPSEFIPQMIKWYRDGNFPIDKLVKQFSIEAFAKGIEEMYEGVAIKPVLVWP